MVKKIGKNYECEDCKLLYVDKAWAQKCEEFCIRHKACNLAITKHSINLKKLH
ncbi:hypothetical protein HY989_00865 [Candidatus Micrarchaeota archaeon]|nr:hypothetical protein [Candidatus Micrarchaeota archaeon]